MQGVLGNDIWRSLLSAAPMALLPHVREGNVHDNRLNLTEQPCVIQCSHAVFAPWPGVLVEVPVSWQEKLIGFIFKTLVHHQRASDQQAVSLLILRGHSPLWEFFAPNAGCLLSQ